MNGGWLHHGKHRGFMGAVTALVIAVTSPSLRAESDPAPAQPGNVFQGIGVEPHLGKNVPLDLTFTDSTGATVKLGDYFKGDRPVVLNLVYYGCPMMCPMAVDTQVNVLKQLGWTPGENYQLVTVSFDPTEKPDLAAAKQWHYLTKLGTPQAKGGWAFLTGEKANIDKLTEAVGFTYRRNEATGQYDHGAALIVLTPQGVISRYLGGFSYDDVTLRRSIVEASGSKVGSLADKLFLGFCGTFDPNAGKYVVAAWKVMRLGGAMTVAVIAAALLLLWRHERRKRAAVGCASAPHEVSGVLKHTLQS